MEGGEGRAVLGSAFVGELVRLYTVEGGAKLAVGIGGRIGEEGSARLDEDILDVGDQGVV